MRYPLYEPIELPRYWRLALIAVATLILCSCRAPLPSASALPGGGGVAGSRTPNALPAPRASQRFTQPAPVRPAAHQQLASPVRPAAHFAHGPPCPAPLAAAGPPTPDLSARAGRPWPPDEYLCDGGDQPLHAKIGPDFAVYGLDVEDAIAHYDTLDGRRVVEPTNKVCIYAPRFASVRQVRGMQLHEQHDLVGRIHMPLKPNQHEDTGVAVAFDQTLPTVRQIGTKRASTFRERNAGVGLDNAQSPHAYQDRLAVHVPLQVVESSTFDQAEKARLANAIDAAITWSHDHTLIVAVGKQRLSIDTHDTKLGQTFMVDHKGTPALQIAKMASTKTAQPGDEVEFALWFDNIGDEPIGNVTIIDNLTTRLEYVEGSQSCTLEADFFTEPNDAGSLALRWEIIAPIEPGKGGICRFRCRVR